MELTKTYRPRDNDLCQSPPHPLLHLCSLLQPHSTPRAAPSPGYNAPWRNRDGSPKLALEFAGGGTPTLGATRRYQTHGWTYRMGGGYHFTRRLSLLGEYTYNHFSIPQSLVNSLFSDPSGQEGGDVHLWSLTADPTFQYLQSDHYGAYVVFGGGFYRKLTIFRHTTTGCTQLNPCEPEPDIARFSNNTGGLEGGFGFAYRPSDYSNAKLFVETRYVWVDNQPSPRNTSYLPANWRTGYLPLTAGVRW